VCVHFVSVCGRPARLWTADIVVVVVVAAAGEFLLKRFQIAQRMKTKEKMKHIESEHITKRSTAMLSTYQSARSAPIRSPIYSYCPPSDPLFPRDFAWPVDRPTTIARHIGLWHRTHGEI